MCQQTIIDEFCTVSKEFAGQTARRATNVSGAWLFDNQIQILLVFYKESDVYQVVTHRL